MDLSYKELFSPDLTLKALHNSCHMQTLMHHAHTHTLIAQPSETVEGSVYCPRTLQQVDWHPTINLLISGQRTLLPPAAMAGLTYPSPNCKPFQRE